MAGSGRSKGGKKIAVHTHDDQEFWPSLAGIPIKHKFWDMLVKPPDGAAIGAKQLPDAGEFSFVNRMLEQAARSLRSGILDDGVDFGQLPSEEVEYHDWMLETMPDEIMVKQNDPKLYYQRS